MDRTLRLGSTIPNFSATTTQGSFASFHEWIGDSWCILFSHPGDYTPVCTTELGEVARKQQEFREKNTKVIGISVNSLQDHFGWIKDINEVGNNIAPTYVDYPIIADEDRKIATLLDMLDYQDETNRDSNNLPLTVRTVFLIDPKKTIRLMITYPASCGRDFTEIVRVLDSLQLTDRYKIATPVNWRQGENVIVHPAVSNEDAGKLFPDHVAVRPYLRLTPLPAA